MFSYSFPFYVYHTTGCAFLKVILQVWGGDRSCSPASSWIVVLECHLVRCFCARFRERLDFHVKFIHRARIFHMYFFIPVTRNNQIDIQTNVFRGRIARSYLLTFISHDRLRFIRGVCVILSTLLEAINLDEYEPTERLSNTKSSRVRCLRETCFSTIQNFYTNRKLKHGGSLVLFRIHSD